MSLPTCSLKWKAVVTPELQVEGPGRDLSTPTLYPGEEEEDEDRLHPAVCSFTHPSTSSLPVFFLPFFFHDNVCCRTNVFEVTCYLTCTHKNDHGVSHPHSLSLLLTGEQRPAVPDRGDCPLRVCC